MKLRDVNCKAIPALILSALLSCPATHAQQLVKLKSSISKVQPMTGIVFWADNDLVAQHSDAISLEYRYCGYNEVVRADGRYDWAVLDAALDEIASRNHQAILRFYFAYVGRETTVPDFIRRRNDYQETIAQSEGQQTHFCDWRNTTLREFTFDFYERFAARYDKDPRIAFLQTGFGLWAEYHIYSGPRDIGRTFPDKDYQAKFLRHLDQHFEHLPWSISVDAADNFYSPLEDNEALLALQFGVFDDSFLCKTHPNENAVNWRILDSTRWKRQPGGGEFSYYNKNDQRNALAAAGPNGVAFAAAAEQFHITYMIGNDQPRYQSIERIKAAGMATGYRFRVTRATTDGRDLVLKVRNEGVAPIYRDAYFAADKKRSTDSLRGLLPGEERVCVVRAIDVDDLKTISIHCDAILPTQQIEYEADLD